MNDETIDTVLGALQAMKNVQETQRRAQQVSDYWSENYARFAPVLNELTPHLTDVSVNGSCVDITVSGNYTLLLKVLRILRRNGFKSGAFPKMGEASFSSYFRDEREDETSRSDAKFWLYFTSTVCRQVKVGTKLVEQAVYEIICDEEPQT